MINPTSAPFLNKSDIDGLKAYVQAPSAACQAESTILMHCSHSNLKAKFFEIRLDRHVSLWELFNLKATWAAVSPPAWERPDFMLRMPLPYH